MDEDILQPADLRPAEPAQEKPPRRGPPPLWLGAFALLLLGLSGIFFLRGRLPESPPPRPEPTSVPATPTPDPGARMEAEAVLNELITALRGLRESRPELWAPEIWQNILDGQQAGNLALAERRFHEARDAYKAALTAAQGLSAELVNAPARLWTLAQSAYAEGRAQESVSALEALLTLRPGDPQAEELLPRARVADQSHAALLEARGALAAGEAYLAWLAMQELETLDADFPGLAGLREEIRAALDADAGEAALRAERRAEQIKRAEALEAAGDWAAATEAWLRMPDAMPPGKDGQLRAWATLDERIRRAGELPRSPQAELLENELAARTLDELPAVLATRARAFLERRAALRRPVSLRLISDGETTVRILRVRELAPFGEQRLELLPGTYTLLATRMGHRDVRMNITLEPGSPEVSLEIRTTESLQTP